MQCCIGAVAADVAVVAAFVRIWIQEMAGECCLRGSQHFGGGVTAEKDLEAFALRRCGRRQSLLLIGLHSK